MSQDWEYGNTARQPAYNESANPFAPIDYAARLHGSARQPQPGPAYAQPPFDPNGYPANAQPDWYGQQGYAGPDYGMPQGQQPAPGAPYNAATFVQQPAIPSGWQPGTFDDQSAVQFWQDQPTPAWAAQEMPAEPEPIYYARADIPLRDAFTPASAPQKAQQPGQEAPQASKPDKQPQQKASRYSRPARMLALIAAVIMLTICGVVGGSMLTELVRAEKAAAQFRADYLAANGVDLYHGAAKVDLLPEGEEYPSTPTPEPTLFVPTPKPTPIIPIGSDFHNGAADTPDATETPEPALRSRLQEYPRNRMRNVSPGLADLRKENAEVVGQLVIEGLVNETVVQRNNTHYLTHDATGAANDCGAVFVDNSCSFRLPPENLLLRGSSFVPGKVFEPLWQFVSGGSDFVSRHMFAHLTSLYEEEDYVLFAVLVADISPAGSRYFNYASNPTFTTDEAMMAYVDRARKASIYNFNVDVQPTDRLLTIATVSNGDNNLVLLYRMVRDNESSGR